MTNITFAVIKPDAVKNGYTTSILFKIEKSGFKIIAMKMMQISQKIANKFYHEHQNSFYFNSLITFMSSGPIIPIMLKKNNAVKDFRILMGNKNPLYAKNGTIRKLYAKSLEQNAIHGSDKNENVDKEYQLFFDEQEIFLK
ncbi:nucleoside-diphosphate kinase [Blattabacterium cuenoti]|uniref:nucleoside-diphosphate kinase n=1 Tax=Blattabacterium cuenoti TaxID=1653831 RepID=UPI00163CC73C|nr:nucleoside-diphosphate kinase [Blattabacterium cuenoti]